ncbi:MAG: hypothetical protein RR772_00685, partial [Gordonibacter sp.]
MQAKLAEHTRNPDSPAKGHLAMPAKRVSPSRTCSASFRGAAPLEPKRPAGVSCEQDCSSDGALPNVPPETLKLPQEPHVAFYQHAQ